MEKHQTEHITRNLWDLLRLTSFNTTCKSILKQNGILSIEDEAELKSIPNELKKIEKLYELLLTKKGSYAHLKTALTEDCQTGALEILNKLDDHVAATSSDTIGAIQKQRNDPVRFEVLPPVFNFTGRELKLCELHDKLQENEERVVISQIAAVVGLGGIGKTELARKYIQNYVAEFYDGNVIWITSQTEGAMSETFRRLACNRLNISLVNADGKELDITTIVEKVYNYFNGQKVLFVFDNAESTDYIQTFLPISLPSSSSGPYILITSRDTAWELSVPVLELDEMTEEDAFCFVKVSLQVKNDEDDINVLRLVNRLQQFPLALSQAVSFIRNRRLLGAFSISQYLDKFNENSVKLLDSKKSPAELNTYSETTLTTWRVTVNQIASYEENGPLAVDILNSISYFLPDKISMDIFSNFSGEDDYKEALLLLVKYSMINIQKEDETLSVHRLVQETTRIQMKKDNQEGRAMYIALRFICSSIVSGLGMCRDLILHSRSPPFPDMNEEGTSYLKLSKKCVQIMMEKIVEYLDDISKTVVVTTSMHYELKNRIDDCGKRFRQVLMNGTLNGINLISHCIYMEENKEVRQTIHSNTVALNERMANDPEALAEESNLRPDVLEGLVRGFSILPGVGSSLNGLELLAQLQLAIMTLFNRGCMSENTLNLLERLKTSEGIQFSNGLKMLVEAVGIQIEIEVDKFKQILSTSTESTNF